MVPKNAVAAASRPVWAKGLDEREFLFVSWYIVGFEGTKAALAAGCPKASAHAQAWQIKQRPHVREAIDAALREKMPAIKMVLSERLAAIATADHADYFQIVEKKTRSKDPGKDGKRKTFTETTMRITPTADLTERQRAAVKGIKQRVGLYGTTLELQLHDPMMAIDRIAALLNLQPREQVVGGGTVSFIIEAPDGSVLKSLAQTTSTSQIDRAAIDAQIAADAEPVEDLPPGAKPQTGLVIETP